MTRPWVFVILLSSSVPACAQRAASTGTGSGSGAGGWWLLPAMVLVGLFGWWLFERYRKRGPRQWQGRSAQPLQAASEDLPGAASASPRSPSDAEAVVAYLQGIFGPKVATLEGAERTFTALQRQIAETRRQLADLQRQAPDALPAPIQPLMPSPNWQANTIAEGLAAVDKAQVTMVTDAEFIAFWQQCALDTVVTELGSLLQVGADDFGPSLLAVIDEPWFFDLLRAECLSASYYASEPGWRPLRTGLGLIAGLGRSCLLEQGILIDTIAPLSLRPTGNAELVQDEQLRLRQLDTPRRIVTMAASRCHDRRVVIDCLRFGRESGGRLIDFSSRLVTYNPAQWERG